MNKKPPIDIWSRPANMMMVLWWHWWWFVPNEEEEDNDDLCRTAAAARRRIEESLKRKVFRRWVLLILLNLGCSPSCHPPQHLFKDYKYSGNKLTKVILVHKKICTFKSQVKQARFWNPSKLQGIPGQCIAMVLSSCFEFSSSFASKKTEDWDISGVLLCVWVWIRELFLDTKNCQ